MGNCCAKQRRARVLLLGLDSAGKTTIIHRLKYGEKIQTVPTIGFNIENVQYKGLELNIWDVGGQTELRGLWKHYYPGTQGIIWVVDSADRQRMSIAKDELHELLLEVELKSSTLVIIANKQDLPNACRKQEIIELLELKSIKRKYEVFEASATKGTGLNEAIQWLSENMD